MFMQKGDVDGMAGFENKLRTAGPVRLLPEIRPLHCDQPTLRRQEMFCRFEQFRKLESGAGYDRIESAAKRCIPYRRFGAGMNHPGLGKTESPDHVLEERRFFPGGLQQRHLQRGENDFQRDSRESRPGTEVEKTARRAGDKRDGRQGVDKMTDDDFPLGGVSDEIHFPVPENQLVAVDAEEDNPAFR